MSCWSASASRSAASLATGARHEKMRWADGRAATAASARGRGTLPAQPPLGTWAHEQARWRPICRPPPRVLPGSAGERAQDPVHWRICEVAWVPGQPKSLQRLGAMILGADVRRRAPAKPDMQAREDHRCYGPSQATTSSKKSWASTRSNRETMAQRCPSMYGD